MDSPKLKNKTPEELRTQVKWLEVTLVEDLTASLEVDSTKPSSALGRPDSPWEVVSVVILLGLKTTLQLPATQVARTKTNFN